MIEEETVTCPICDHELNVKAFRHGKNTTYLVSNDCSFCKTPAQKIENMLNKSTKRGRIQTEKSYIKVDPRG